MPEYREKMSHFHDLLSRPGRSGGTMEVAIERILPEELELNLKARWLLK
jgi:hypothetical protein